MNVFVGNSYYLAGLTHGLTVGTSWNNSGVLNQYIFQFLCPYIMFFCFIVSLTWCLYLWDVTFL